MITAVAIVVWITFVVWASTYLVPEADWYAHH